MREKSWDAIISLIKKEVVPAVGCTEPTAVALAGAKAAETLKKEPQKIEVFLSRNVLKNGMSVGIPGTGLHGIDIAVAAGICGGRSEKKLEVLHGLSGEDIKRAKTILNAGKVKVFHKEVPESLYIEVILKNGDDNARVIIKERHDNIALVELNGKILFEDTGDSAKEKAKRKEKALLEGMTEREVWNFSTNAPLEEIEFILEAVELNKKISAEGLKGDYGLKVGKSIDGNIAKGILQADLSIEAVKRTAGGADARMAGSNLPVMSNSGSGNQGITATMPVVAVAEKLGSPKEDLIRGMILSHLTSIYIKSKMNRISALCGVSVAATGASCGIVYLLGGKYEHVEYAIKNMVGTVAGMVCDGAKIGCALKVASCVNASIQGALLGINKIGGSDIEGIVEGDIERTINNLGRLATSGMVETDKLVLSIMVSKKEAPP